jgi:hypothetical protein
MGKQNLGDARVFGDHGISGGKCGERPQRHIRQVADWRRNHMQAGQQRRGFGAQAEHGIRLVHRGLARWGRRFRLGAGQNHARTRQVVNHV